MGYAVLFYNKLWLNDWLATLRQGYYILLVAGRPLHRQHGGDQQSVPQEEHSAPVRSPCVFPHHAALTHLAAQTRTPA